MQLCPRAIVRAGTIVDGSGAAAFTGDVAIDNGCIVAVGGVDGPAYRTLEADGLLVTPGFVDIHTHYDGQATWDPLLTPSCWHGVTTAVMGNCGVGFAPMQPGRREFLIELMEGVEDIPGSVLAEGVDWGWESFPEYLDALEAKPRIMDLGAQLPHAALRYYVMGERGAAREPANAEDLQRMAELTEQALIAGALGFSTSRTLLHKTARGEYVPNFGAAATELNAIAAGVRRARRGVLQFAIGLRRRGRRVRDAVRLGARERRQAAVVHASAAPRDAAAMAPAAGAEGQPSNHDPLAC